MNTHKPNIKVRLENDTFKVLEIRGESGDQLSDHKVDNDAVLQLISGYVVYKEGTASIIYKVRQRSLFPKSKCTCWNLWSHQNYCCSNLRIQK